jgi:hypothetical protein
MGFVIGPCEGWLGHPLLDGDQYAARLRFEHAIYRFLDENGRVLANAGGKPLKTIFLLLG